MHPEYTINDAHREGFENGLLYMLRYYETFGVTTLTDDDISELASHLELKKPWKTREEWLELICTNLERWRG